MKQQTMQITIAMGIIVISFLFMKATAEIELNIEFADSRPLITWSNTVGSASELIFLTASGQCATITETPYVGTGAVNSWSPSEYSTQSEIIYAADSGYRFRIISISNNTINGSARIEWTCRSGAVYRVLRTSDPRDWSAPPIATSLPAVVPFTSFLDASAGLGPRFYAIEVSGSNGWERSENAAGFYTISVNQSSPGSMGELLMLRNDFAPLNGAPYHFQEIFRFQPPLGSRAYRWSDDRSKTPFVGTHYITSTLTASGWQQDSDQIYRGQGIFLGITSNQNAFYLSLRGELPSSFYASTSSIPIISSGTNMDHLIGYPYPVDILLTNMVLWKEANRGDWIYTLSTNSPGTLNGYNKGGPINNVSNVIIRCGEGFFYRPVKTAVYDRVWNEPKPYTWP
jgi:hypothetical protein